MAMMALKISVLNDYMQLLEEHADMVNLPQIGIDDNVAFPAVQANIAPAVALHKALGICYIHFKLKKRSRKFNGCFHLFGLRVYVIVKPKTASLFSGLGKHGETPPITPNSMMVVQNATQLMIVFYCPKAALSLRENSIPLASLPNGTPLFIGPEITNP